MNNLTNYQFNSLPRHGVGDFIVLQGYVNVILLKLEIIGVIHAHKDTVSFMKSISIMFYNYFNIRYSFKGKQFFLKLPYFFLLL